MSIMYNMTTIMDLPMEIIESLPLYVEDIISLKKTCKRFRNIIPYTVHSCYVNEKSDSSTIPTWIIPYVYPTNTIDYLSIERLHGVDFSRYKYINQKKSTLDLNTIVPIKNNLRILNICNIRVNTFKPLGLLFDLKLEQLYIYPENYLNMDLEELGQLPHTMNTLHISKVHGDIEFIGSLKYNNLVELVLRNANIDSVQFLGKLQDSKLKLLDISNNNITNIESLGELNNSLTHLDISSNNISSISTLGKLSKSSLKYLNVYYCNCNDIESFGFVNKEMTNLHVSYISIPYINKMKLDKSNVSTLDLNRLSFSGEHDNGRFLYNDILSLKSLTISNLLSLYPFNDKILVANSPFIVELTLCSMKITDISYLKPLSRPHLKSLNLSHNMIHDITPLGRLAGITTLKLDHNRISTIKSLGLLNEELEHLNLANNNISTIESLGLINKNLRYLNLANNNINNIDSLGLICDSKLEKMILNQCPIYTIDKLGNLCNSKLRKLYIKNTYINVNNIHINGKNINNYYSINNDTIIYKIDNLNIYSNIIYKIRSITIPTDLTTV